MQLPPPPHIVTPKFLPPSWEEDLVQSIAKSQGEVSFAKVYWDFLGSKKNSMSDEERYQWLSCISYYTNWHDDKDIVQQWTAIVDNRPSRVIYPQDIDKEMGIDRKPDHARPIPEYLRIPASRPATSLLQKKLFDDYGILAIDHTDQHSSVVLKELLFLLKNGLGKNLIQQLPSLHYIYAFAGHDPQSEIAAYHHEVKAISVGGVMSYPQVTLKKQYRFNLLAALAHEIGHAFVFDHMSPAELKQVAEVFGHWPLQPEQEAPTSLYAPLFFQHLQTGFFSLENLTTEYAEKNIHEWFAEAFAARILLNLGESGLLGKGWKLSLIKSTGPNNYWIHYQNLTPGFRVWLNKKIQDVLSHSAPLG